MWKLEGPSALVNSLPPPKAHQSFQGLKPATLWFKASFYNHAGYFGLFRNMFVALFFVNVGHFFAVFTPFWNPKSVNYVNKTVLLCLSCAEKQRELARKGSLKNGNTVGSPVNQQPKKNNVMARTRWEATALILVWQSRCEKHFHLLWNALTQSKHLAVCRLFIAGSDLQSEVFVFSDRLVWRPHPTAAFSVLVNCWWPTAN